MVRREAKDRAILTAAAVSVAASSIPIQKEVITMPDIKTRVKRTIQEQLFLKDNEIGDSDTLEELGADSLDEVELIMALEEEFEIEIADADAEKFKTVQDVVDYITGLGIVPE